MNADTGASTRLAKTGVVLRRQAASPFFALGKFEALCTVSQSVRQGIPIVVEGEDGQGTRLKGSP